MSVSGLVLFISIFWLRESVINVFFCIFLRWDNYTKLRFKQNKTNKLNQLSTVIFLHYKDKSFFPVHSFRKTVSLKGRIFWLLYKNTQCYYIKIHNVCFTYFLYPEANLKLVKWLSHDKKLDQSSDIDTNQKYWIFLLGLKCTSTSFYLNSYILSLCIQISPVTGM